MLLRRLGRLLVQCLTVSAAMFVVLTLQKRRSTSRQQDAKNVCWGRTPRDRICRLSNICFDFSTQAFVHVLGTGNETVQFDGLWDDARVADMSSVDDHNTYYWRWKTVPALTDAVLVERFSDAPSHGLEVMVVDKPVHLVKRFFPVNIMHLFHDDILGMLDVRSKFPFIQQLWFIDDYSSHGPYASVYSWFKTPLRQLKDYSDHSGKNKQRMICFSDAVIGNSKRFVWYQYGFKEPQSVVHQHTVKGRDLAQAFSQLKAMAGSAGSSHLRHEFERKRASIFRAIKQRVPGKSVPDPNVVIALFTRRKTRILLNEAELAASLQARFNLPVVRVGLENHSVEQIVAIMSKTAIAIGLHGSLLVMAGFMPPGGILIEAFPFAIPPQDYRPYAEMARILGHRYAAWSSSHSSEPHTKGHPERGKYEGGLKHLSREERQSILALRWVKPHKCCYNAAWLYRIFQDTAVDPADIVRTIEGLLD